MTLVVDENTWIISDTHFGHKNIIKYCKRPKNHDQLMLRNWKKLVKKSDVILHLGDVTVWYGEHYSWARTVSKLPGKKFLILGNHDRQWTKGEWTNRWGFKILDPFRQNKIYFSHEPEEDGEWEVNVHGHSHDHVDAGYYCRNGKFYYNASVEGMQYQPVRLGKIIAQIAHVAN